MRTYIALYMFHKYIAEHVSHRDIEANVSLYFSSFCVSILVLSTMTTKACIVITLNSKLLASVLVNGYVSRIQNSLNIYVELLWVFFIGVFRTIDGALTFFFKKIKRIELKVQNSIMKKTLLVLPSQWP